MSSQSSTTTDNSNTVVHSEGGTDAPVLPTNPPDMTIGPTSTMLATMQVRILASASKSSQPVRALADSGSQLNLITHDCVQRLGMRFSPSTTHITGIGNTNAMRAFGIIDTHVQHRCLAEPMISVRLLVVAKISTRLPVHRTKNVFKPDLKPEQLADPQYWVPAKIDMLIGAGVWSKIVEAEIIRKDVDSTTYLAQKTLFGWTILSSPDRAANGAYLTLHTLAVDEQSQLDQLERSIQRFWEIDTIHPKPLLTRDEKLADEIFTATHSRDQATGRYTVNIPFRAHVPALGESRQTALKRLQQLESRMTRKPELAQEYHSFFEDYLATGHMIPAPPPPSNCSDAYYIPYHGIFKKKPRIVFDASSATSTGVSLNDHQLSGPKLQDDLCQTLLRFRLHRYGVSADVAKMFRQVQVNKEHWNYQRILWRASPDKPIQDYYITVVVWGIASATFNAVRALRQCAMDEKTRFPIASRMALEDFYVDDFLSGTDDTTSLITLHDQLTQMLQSGGFPLAKWSTNNPELASRFGQRSSSEVQFDTDAGVLGMTWSPDDDKLRVKLAKQDDLTTKRPTKADIVSAISKLYDPSGIYGPITVIGKIIMQDFWRIEGLGWYDPAPRDLVERWKHFNIDIKLITSIPVPRWIGSSPSDHLEWHIFTDASEKAYGAVAYLRVTKPNGSISCHILTSKSRVAPLKTQSIPRLELFGALLGAKLGSFVKSACHLERITSFYWTDSTIVLSWLKKEPAVLTSFIGTRTSEILELTRGHSWHHVRGDCNPADILSRGGTVSQLCDSPTWWHGPDWLSKPIDQWPDRTTPTLSSTEAELAIKELKRPHRAPAKPLAISKVLFASANIGTSESLPRGHPSSDQLSIKNSHGRFRPLCDIGSSSSSYSSGSEIRSQHPPLSRRRPNQTNISAKEIGKDRMRINTGEESGSANVAAHRATRCIQQGARDLQIQRQSHQRQRASASCNFKTQDACAQMGQGYWSADTDRPTQQRSDFGRGKASRHSPSRSRSSDADNPECSYQPHTAWRSAGVHRIPTAAFLDSQPGKDSQAFHRPRLHRLHPPTKNHR